MTESNPTPDKPIRRTSIFRRIRPVWYILAGTLLILALMVTLTYAVSLGRKPTPTVDYLAMLNAPALAVPEEDAAWPLYRELAIKYDVLKLKTIPGWGPKRNPHYKPTATQPDTQPAGPTTTGPSLDEIWGSGPDTSNPFLDSDGPITRDDPRWPQAMAEALKYADLYEGLRQASRKKGMGALVSDRYDDKVGSFQIVADFSANIPPLWRNSILFSYHPFWRMGRIYARMLSVDFHIALHQGDLPRAIDNLQAQQDIAIHMMEAPFLINRLVNYGIRVEMLTNMATLLTKDGQALTPDQYRWLAQLLQPMEGAATYHDIERLMLQDSMQRLYDSQGVITYAGIRSFGNNDRIHHVMEGLFNDPALTYASACPDALGAD